MNDESSFLELELLSIQYGRNNIMAAHRDCCLRTLTTAEVLCGSSTWTPHLILQVMFSRFVFQLEIDFVLPLGSRSTYTSCTLASLVREMA